MEAPRTHEADDLWDRAREGREGAREALAELASGIARRELEFRGAPRDELEALAQQTVASVLAFLERGGEVRENLVGFLTCRAWGVLSDARKKARRAAPTVPLEGHDERPDEDRSTERAFERTELRSALSECASRLGRTLRDVVWLRYEDGLTNQAIAERLGVTANAINLRLFRALRELRACLESKGIDAGVLS